MIFINNYVSFLEYYKFYDLIFDKNKHNRTRLFFKLVNIFFYCETFSKINQHTKKQNKYLKKWKKN